MVRLCEPNRLFGENPRNKIPGLKNPTSSKMGGNFCSRFSPP